jgi:hypothetical protein
MTYQTYSKMTTNELQAAFYQRFTPLSQKHLNDRRAMISALAYNDCYGVKSQGCLSYAAEHYPDADELLNERDDRWMDVEGFSLEAWGIKIDQS